jgi:hypothetical protein
MSASGGQRHPGRRGKLVVLTVVGLGVLAAVVKIILEIRVGPHVRAEIAGLRRELASLPPKELLDHDHRGLREFIARSYACRELDYYRDRAIPLLEEAYRNETGPGAGPFRAAWLLILLRIDHPRSRRFFEEETPSIAEPDLRRDAEAYLARQGLKR